jgi:hypothetical protein
VQACSKHTNRILLCAEFDEVPSLAIRGRGRSINHLSTPEGVVRNRPRSTTSPSWWSAQEWLQTSPRSIWIVFSWEQSLRSEEPAHPIFRQLWLGLDLLDRAFIDNPLVQIGVTDSLAATIPKSVCGNFDRWSSTIGLETELVIYGSHDPRPIGLLRWLPCTT